MRGLVLAPLCRVLCRRACRDVRQRDQQLLRRHGHFVGRIEIRGHSLLGAQRGAGMCELAARRCDLLQPARHVLQLNVGISQWQS